MIYSKLNLYNVISLFAMKKERKMQKREEKLAQNLGKKSCVKNIVLTFDEFTEVYEGVDVS